MRRKSQVSMVFIIVTAAIVLILIFVYGMNTIKKMQEGQCDSDYLLFKTKLNSAVERLRIKPGSTETITIDAPCNAERVLILDTTKGASFKGLDRHPLVMNELEEGTGNNLFIIDQGRMQQAQVLDRLDLPLPYFICIDNINGKMQMKVEGLGRNKVQIIPAADYDCTFDYSMPIELDIADFVPLLSQIINAPFINQLDSKEVNLETHMIVDPLWVGLSRDIEIQPDNTTITIGKDRGSFRYFEMIPKCAMQGETYDDTPDTGNIEIVTTTIVDPKILDYDPLITWDFAQQDNTEIVKYSIKKTIDEDCLREFKGLGLWTAEDQKYLATKQQEPERSLESAKVFENTIIGTTTGSIAQSVAALDVQASAFDSTNEAMGRGTPKDNIVIQAKVEDTQTRVSINNQGAKGEFTVDSTQKDDVIRRIASKSGLDVTTISEKIVFIPRSGR